jgi:UDP-glucose 4-epimerase
VFDAETNLIGTLRIIEAAREVSVQRFLFVSSGGACYGNQENSPAREGDPTNPVSPYGVSKRSGEHYCFYYQVEHGLPYVALRYANVYGPRQDPHGEAGVIAIFCQKLLKGEPMTIHGDGGQTRDYVFVEDVVAANRAALTADFTGPVNVGTGVETDVNTLAKELIHHARAKLEPIHGPAMPGEQRRSVIDPGLAGGQLGWKPRVSLADGLRRTFDWFREDS